MLSGSPVYHLWKIVSLAVSSEGAQQLFVSTFKSVSSPRRVASTERLCHDEVTSIRRPGPLNSGQNASRVIVDL
jgi:hypothetical protein